MERSIPWFSGKYGLGFSTEKPLGLEVVFRDLRALGVVDKDLGCSDLGFSG